MGLAPTSSSARSGLAEQDIALMGVVFWYKKHILLPVNSELFHKTANFVKKKLKRQGVRAVAARITDPQMNQLWESRPKKTARRRLWSIRDRHLDLLDHLTLLSVPLALTLAKGLQV